MDDGETVDYEFDELLHAYTITVHRSQGSEYPWVVIPLSKTAGGLMLRRNLFYTALTRAKQGVVLVGQPEALELAIKQTAPRRHTGLTRRLTDGLERSQ
jgi:exodeoxyribonuclease V alpha subunit